MPRWPFPAACGHSQGVALPHRLSHAAGLFSPFTWLETIGGHYGPLRVLRPAGRDVERYASLYTCGFLSLLLNLSQCARGWSSAHVSNASYVAAVHELHQHLRPFACEMLRAQVRRVCFRGDLLHRQLVVVDRLLEPQVLNFNVLYFAQARSAYYGQCCTGVNVQPNRGRLYPGLWQTPELPSTLLLHGCQRTVLLRRCWWLQCFAASSKP